MLTNRPASAAPTGDAAFRELFRNVPGPVTVVTTIEHGRVHATTVSSFCSLSMSPAYAFLALDAASRLLSVVERTRRVGINVLSDDQDAIGLRCASKEADKLNEIDWSEVIGVARIGGVAGFLSCQVADLIEVGDHTIVVAAPEYIDSSEKSPLLYHRASFRCVGQRTTAP